MSNMQHFSVEVPADDDQPLYAGWASGGYQRFEKSGWSPDDSGRSGIMGRFDEWWHGMTPAARTKLKQGLIIAGVVSLLAIIISVATTQSTKSSPEPAVPASTPTPGPAPSDVPGSSQGGPGTDRSIPDPSTALPSPPAAPINFDPSPSPPPPPQDLVPSPVPVVNPAPLAPSPPPSIPPPPPPTPDAPGAPITADIPDDALCNWNSTYLPDIVIPVEYALDLTTFLQAKSTDPAVKNQVTGMLTAYVRILKPTRCLVLNSHDLITIPDAADFNGELLGTVTFNKANQQIIVKFDEPIQPDAGFDPNAPFSPDSDQGDARFLEISFSYPLNPGLDGFYTSQYTADGITHTIASTQFQSIAARKAFPCWDEPRFKARLQLTITTPPGLKVLSNMPEVPGSATEAPVDQALDTRLYTKRTFQLSPPMSTYLMAWVVGEFQSSDQPCSTKTDPDAAPINVPVAVYGLPSRSGLLETAKSMACAALKSMVGMIGVPYSLPKLDLIAIPDFAAGGMENWGLIMFRETSLLAGPESKEDVAQIVKVALAVAHEISHQWFGNLVTCRDWNELWLNEGFASYFQYLAADAWDKEYGFPQFFTFPETTMPALVEDSLRSSHALSTTEKISQYSQIDDYFDDISYKKGASVLRMLRMYMTVVLESGVAFTAGAPTTGTTNSGPLLADGTVKPVPLSPQNVSMLPLRKRALLEAAQGGAGRELLATFDTFTRPTWKTEPFLAALKAFLEKYKYKSVTQQDLWGSMSETTGLPLSTIMQSWTLDENYPVLHVDSVIEDDTTNRATLQLRQAPILGSRQCGVRPDNAPATHTGKWWIPIGISVDEYDSTVPLQFVTMSECTATITIATQPSAAVLLNAARYGFYRVNYTEDQWSMILEKATNALVGATDMAGLLSDTYRLSEAKQLSIKHFLDLVNIMQDRSTYEYQPWAAMLSKLQHMRVLLSTAASKEGGDKLTCRDNLDKWVADVAGQDMDNLELGFAVEPDYEDVRQRMLRPLVMKAAGLAGRQTILDEAVSIMKDIQAAVMAGQAYDVTPIHPDVRGVAYCLNVMASNDATQRATAFNATMRMYQRATNPMERKRLLTALACVREDDQALITLYLQQLLTPQVRLQDVGDALLELGQRGGKVFEAVWIFLGNSLPQITARWPQYSVATYSLGIPIKKLAMLWTHFDTESAMQSFVNLWNQQGLLDPAFMSTYREYTRNNMDWLSVNAPPVCTYLADRLSPGNL